LIAFACVAITAVALYYIFHIPELLVAGPEKTRVTFLRERKEAVYENLRDLNFEFKAGKLPDRDYQTMKNSLEDEAAGILAEIAQIESGTQIAVGIKSKKGQRG
jgi:hypothetical protein